MTQQGLKGEIGERGPPGLKGDRGLNGSPGLDGLSGSKGLRGEIGPQGPPGKTVIETVFRDDAKGARGDKGEKGDPGSQGFQGKEGVKVRVYLTIDTYKHATACSVLLNFYKRKGVTADYVMFFCNVLQL